jgi:hypothetical protein
VHVCVCVGGGLCVCVCVGVCVVIRHNGAELMSMSTPAEGELLRAVLFQQLQHHQYYTHQPQQPWQHKLNHL